LSLPWKIAFPDGEDGLGRESVRMLGKCAGKPSISRCLDHSAMQTITTFGEKLATILIKLHLVTLGALMLVNYNQ
jgi:hypothetical protein